MARVGKSPDLSRDAEEEHRRAWMQMNKQKDTAEITSRQRKPFLTIADMETGEVVFQEQSSLPLSHLQCKSPDSLQDQIAQFPLLCLKHRQGFPL